MYQEFAKELKSKKTEFASKPGKEEISDAKKAYLTDAKPHFGLICVINVKTENKFTISRKNHNSRKKV